MPPLFRFIFWPHDYKKSVDFYEQGLGCAIISQWDKGPGRRGTVFNVGAGDIEILELGQEGKSVINPQGFEIYIEVPNVDEYYQVIKDKSIPILGEIADKPWGDRTFSINDPDGIKLIFCQVSKGT